MLAEPKCGSRNGRLKMTLGWAEGERERVREGGRQREGHILQKGRRLEVPVLAEPPTEINHG